MSEIFVGVDVSKDKLDVAVRPSGQELSVTNSAPGFEELSRWLATLGEVFVVVEATGALERDLVAALHRAGHRVSVANPRQVRDFARSTGKLAKTDRIDSHVLAHYGEAVRPLDHVPKTEEQRKLGELVVRRRQLVSARSAEKMILKQSPVSVRSSVNAHIQWLNDQIKSLEKKMSLLLRTCPRFRELDTLLQSVPGVGPATSATLLSALPELGQLDRRRLAALAGVAPLNCDSGRRQSPRQCRGGRSDVRVALYMAAVVGIRHNPAIGALYRRLKAREKPTKVAIVACVRKLLSILNAIVRNRTPFEAPIQGALPS